MLSGGFPAFGQTQFRHGIVSHNIGTSCGEEMPMERIDTFHLFGKGSHIQEGVPKKSSSALATTLSTCQVPGSKLAGGTSLLVASVLGKNAMKPKQVRGAVKRKTNDRERRKELLALSPNDNVPSSNGKGRAGILALPPRSMSINGPRIGNLNSPPTSHKFVGANMTYLFDKVASVTDCRSTGHFVLPKRKVEEHFPLISKPGGIWMKLLDNKGKEWSFEFCFWHSKDSRIYYFKKFYPFVQSANLCGGDTVFFSRLEPEGTLYMSVKDRIQKPPQPKHTKAGGVPKDQFKVGEPSNEGLRYLANDWSPSLDEAAPRQGKKPPTVVSVDEAKTGYASDRGVYHKRKRKRECPPGLLSQRTNLMDQLAVGEVPVVSIEKKSTGRRSITPEDFQHVDRVGGVLGSERKRLRINMEEYSEWKDIQDLLRPAPGVVPTVVTVDGHDFEEYEEPPVLSKGTYDSRETHGENLWVKCSDCGSWRRVPSDAFVAARWVCSDNDRDLERAYCSAPQEMSDFEVHQLLGIGSEAEDDDEGDEGDGTYKESMLWSATRTLVDGFKKSSTGQAENGSCNFYSSDLETQNHGNTLQSFSLQQLCDLGEKSTPVAARRPTFLVPGVGNDSVMSTDCYDFLGRAGTARGCEMSTTETEVGEFLGSVEKM